MIDAAATKTTAEAAPAHLLVELSPQAIERFKDDLRLYWVERSRRACHRNIMSIHNLITLYDTPIDEINRLSEAKYGVTYFCPDGGVYAYEASTDRVTCSVHGNRQNSRQDVGISDQSSFSRLFDSLEDVTARLSFRDDSLLATVEIVRREANKKGNQ